MSYTNSTTHYGLPLPTGSDKSLFTDTNQAFQDIDAAIYDAATLVGQAGLDIGALQGRMTTAEGNISDNADDIAALKGRMTAVEGVSSQNTTDIADVRADAEDMITAHNEATATSASHYEIGDEFIYNDVLYLATVEINIGDTIVPNTNCEATNVMTEVAEVKSDLGDITSDASTAIYLRNSLFGDNQVVHAQRIGDYIIASFNGYTDVGGLTADDFVIAAFSNDLTLEIGNNIGFINADGSQPHTCALTVSNENHNIRCSNPIAGRYFSFETVFKIIS